MGGKDSLRNKNKGLKKEGRSKGAGFFKKKKRSISQTGQKGKQGKTLRRHKPSILIGSLARRPANASGPWFLTNSYSKTQVTSSKKKNPFGVMYLWPISGCIPTHLSHSKISHFFLQSEVRRHRSSTLEERGVKKEGDNKHLLPDKDWPSAL